MKRHGFSSIGVVIENGCEQLPPPFVFHAIWPGIPRAKRCYCRPSRQGHDASSASSLPCGHEDARLSSSASNCRVRASAGLVVCQSSLKGTLARIKSEARPTSSWNQGRNDLKICTRGLSKIGEQRRPWTFWIRKAHLIGAFGCCSWPRVMRTPHVSAASCQFELFSYRPHLRRHGLVSSRLLDGLVGSFAPSS